AAHTETHTALPERAIAAVASTHPAPFRWSRLIFWRLVHRREPVEIVEMAMDDLVASGRDLSGRRERIAIVAKEIDWQVGPPSPNTPTFPAVSIEMVKLSRGCAGDDGGLAVPPDSVLSNPLVGGINIEHRDVAASARDKSERAGISEFVGQLCGA